MTPATIAASYTPTEVAAIVAGIIVVAGVLAYLDNDAARRSRREDEHP